MLKFKKGDTVKVTLGKDKGREGSIETINVKKRLALIPGINIYKRHVKASPTNSSEKGGIYEIPRALSFGKIALVCPKCKKMTRVSFKIVGKEKVRICVKCKKEINV